MSNSDLLRRQNLVENPTPRVAVSLCLDTSRSMRGEKLDAMNQGIKKFYDSIREDKVALASVELCVTSFGGTVESLTDFATLDKQDVCQITTVRKGTPMGHGVNLALDLLENRKKEYQETGVDYYQPWLVIMSDGKANDMRTVDEAASKTTALEDQRKLSVFSIGIGDDADMDILCKFSKKRPALKLQGLKFSEFFGWLSASVSTVSRSQPDETVKLDVEGLKGWAELYL